MFGNPSRPVREDVKTLGINSWIQSITGWQVCPTSKSALDDPQDSVDITTIPDIEQLLEQIEILNDNLKISLKHRHAIHNIVEKPTVVDLSLNQIIHTAVHVQADKLNQALATLQLIRNNALALQSMNHQLQQSQQLWRSITQLTNTVEQTRIENNHLKGIVRQQKALLQSRRQTSKQDRLTTTPLELERVLVVRVQEIYNILMSQQQSKKTRGMNTCTKKAKIYARYEIGQSLTEIAQALKIPYETVKTYVKLTRAELRKYNCQLN